METLRQKQSRFAKLFAMLILKAYELGYEVTLGEVLRTDAQAEANVKSKAGISNSLHKIRLAGDLMLFKNGVYLTKTEDYTALGEYWESLGGSWGGRFKTRPDGNHFSLEHNGVR